MNKMLIAVVAMLISITMMSAIAVGWDDAWMNTSSSKGNIIHSLDGSWNTVKVFGYDEANLTGILNLSGMDWAAFPGRLAPDPTLKTSDLTYKKS